MPITYTVQAGGHFIHAVASGSVTSEEFVAFEVAHAIDQQIKAPVAELLEVRHDACRNITMEDMARVLQRRKTVQQLPTPHRCAIVPSLSDTHAWDLAKFYEGMVTLHYPESVIVFGSVPTACVWLGNSPEGSTKPGGS